MEGRKRKGAIGENRPVCTSAGDGSVLDWKLNPPWIMAVGLLIFAAGVLPGQSQPAAATPQPGNAGRGRAIFEGKGACLNCHRVGDQGSRLGPNLTGVGAQRDSLQELEESILDPDAEIQPSNRFYRVVTPGGETITGRLLNHDTFSVQLIDPKERILTFQKSGLREHGFAKSSPMPSYRGNLTDEELNDLVAYLASLKGSTQ